MEVERYSHVMHISSTVTGRLLPELDAWDALRAALPAGTVSGAPKVRHGHSTSTGLYTLWCWACCRSASQSLPDITSQISISAQMDDQRPPAALRACLDAAYQMQLQACRCAVGVPKHQLYGRGRGHLSCICSLSTAHPPAAHHGQSDASVLDSDAGRSPSEASHGAAQVRAMQIIDELELAKRGPYGGGVGHVSFTGGMDMALALRTMVIPTAAADTFYEYGPDRSRREWVVHLQAGAGLVADSVTPPHLLPLTCCRISHSGTPLSCGE